MLEQLEKGLGSFLILNQIVLLIAEFMDKPQLLGWLKKGQATVSDSNQQSYIQTRW